MLAFTRRQALAAAGSGLLVNAAPGLVLPALAARLTPTPAQTEGPFYPVAFPADADNDLVAVAGRSAVARGTVTHVGGRVLDVEGRPVSGATVEIWQCDANGRYLHPNDRGQRDDGFQGFGRTVSGADGAYRFRTIRPAPYTGRTPHIHFAVLAPGRPRLVTQMYVEGDPGNARDFIWRSLGAEAQRAVTVALKQGAGAALSATFDIVLA